ncbi:MAG: ABC transporter permease [Candidatus Hadarchaeaceae archaeon]
MSEQLLSIVLRSLGISGMALLLSALWSLPISFILGLHKFRGRETIISIFNSFLGIPTVALGLILYLTFSNRGPLGFANLLYTPTAIMIGQAILITPIFISVLINAIESVDPLIRDLAKTLGASERQTSLTILKEAKKGTILAMVSSFNRAISELGIAMMLGGNLLGITRTMTTQIALGISRGELMLSLETTVVLLAIAFSLTLIANRLRRD